MDRTLLEQMGKRLRHRGPDEYGIRLHRNVGFVQTRLSIIDLEGGRQPFADERGRFLVANGEIYNHVELRKRLAAAGRRFRSRSDCETILHGYALDGVDVLERLHGMFAFALHDPGAGETLLVRDRLGIKPLYYCHSPDRLIFASEIKALVPFLGEEPRLEPDVLADYLQSQFSSRRRTAIEQIHRLLPGELLRIGRDLEVRRECYWSPADVSPSSLAPAEASQAFDELFRQVMREHVRSDVPFGLFLSGGVDSAAVLAALDELGAERIHTYSIGWKESRRGDELEDSGRVARHFSSHHREIRVGREAILSRIPRMVWNADELLRDYACLPTMVLAEEASHDVKVVFTGEGGDEVFAGYGRYRRNWLQRRVGSLLDPAGGFRSRGQWQDSLCRLLTTPALDARLKSFRAPFCQAWGETPGEWSDLRRCQYVDLRTSLPGDLLLKVDRMLMANGVEGRVPFLDHRLVEFGISLQDHIKIRGREGKLLLRQWAAERLPSRHLHRPKKGFRVPLGEWTSESLSNRIVEVLTMNRGIREWFLSDRLRACAREARRRPGWAQVIWTLLFFALWHRCFIELADPPPPECRSDPFEWLRG